MDTDFCPILSVWVRKRTRTDTTYAPTAQDPFRQTCQGRGYQKARSAMKTLMNLPSILKTMIYGRPSETTWVTRVGRPPVSTRAVTPGCSCRAEPPAVVLSPNPVFAVCCSPCVRLIGFREGTVCPTACSPVPGGVGGAVWCLCVSMRSLYGSIL